MLLNNSTHYRCSSDIEGNFFIAGNNLLPCITFYRSIYWENECPMLLKCLRVNDPWPLISIFAQPLTQLTFLGVNVDTHTYQYQLKSGLIQLFFLWLVVSKEQFKTLKIWPLCTGVPNKFFDPWPILTFISQMKYLTNLVLLTFLFLMIQGTIWYPARHYSCILRFWCP